MKRIWSIFILALLFAFSGWDTAQAQLQVGLSVGGGDSNFYASIGDYYHVPPAQVTLFHQRRIPDEELPVAFFIAQRAHVPPAAVADFRLTGRSWADVAFHFGVGSDAFYVPLRTYMGTPYERAALFYSRHPRAQWARFRLRDAEIVNFVNLRFAADRYHASPDEVAGWRAKGKSFVAIHEGYRTHWQAEPHPVVRHEVEKHDVHQMEKKNRKKDHYDDHNHQGDDDHHDSNDNGWH